MHRPVLYFYKKKLTQKLSDHSDTFRWVEAQRKNLRIVLKMLRKLHPAARILGHRDISTDRNRNGRVDPWERIKECPCFGAVEEFRDI